MKIRITPYSMYTDFGLANVYFKRIIHLSEEELLEESDFFSEIDKRRNNTPRTDWLKERYVKKEWCFMKTTYTPTKSIVETMNESREAFKNTYGRLLTEDEAIKLTSDIRKELKKEGKLYAK